MGTGGRKAATENAHNCLILDVCKQRTSGVCLTSIIPVSAAEQQELPEGVKFPSLLAGTARANRC